MKARSRKLIAFISASLLLSTAPSTASAQSSFSQFSSSSQPSSPAKIDESPSLQEGEEVSDGFPTPVIPEWAEEPSHESVPVELPPEDTANWEPTNSPNLIVVPGKMRSDREEIPGDFTKEEADLAEVKEAQLRDEDSPTLNSTQGCQVYWPSPFEVCGEIRKLYNSIGGPRSFLTFPKSNELTNPDRVGKRSEFVNGFIYWSPETGAHTVSIPATVVWSSNGWEGGHFGYPMTNDIALGDGWYKQQYQGGYIYTRNAVPAVQAGIQGRIYDKWQEIGAQKSALGYPIGSEETTPDGIGRYNLFQRGIMVWHPTYGAHAITGDVLLQWAYSSLMTQELNYPLEDPKDFRDGWKKQAFLNNDIYGNQLDTFFPKYDPFAGRESDSPSLQAPGVAGGNDYTDQVILETKDKCGNHIVLRRGWYNPVDKNPWGFDKIRYKHNIWSLFSIKTAIENMCPSEHQGYRAIYNGTIYQTINCHDINRDDCQTTTEKFPFRIVYETEVASFLPSYATETRGMNTFYPTDGRIEAPDWFSSTIPNFEDIAGG